MEKNIRIAESRIEEHMLLTRIRKIAKIYGGAIFATGLTFFVIGLISAFNSASFPTNILPGIITFFLIFGGLIIFISGLLHMST